MRLFATHSLAVASSASQPLQSKYAAVASRSGGKVVYGALVDLLVAVARELEKVLLLSFSLILLFYMMIIRQHWGFLLKPLLCKLLVRPPSSFTCSGQTIVTIGSLRLNLYMKGGAMCHDQ
jgi:hypothetical protein